MTVKSSIKLTPMPTDSIEMTNGHLPIRLLAETFGQILALHHHLLYLTYDHNTSHGIATSSAVHNIVLI